MLCNFIKFNLYFILFPRICLLSLIFFLIFVHYFNLLISALIAVLRLSEGSYGPKEGVNVNGRYAHLLSIAPSEGRAEVDQLEMRRDKVLAGMQDGARR